MIPVPKWAVSSRSCPDDHDPSWHLFATRVEAERFIQSEGREYPTDILRLHALDEQ